MIIVNVQCLTKINYEDHKLVIYHCDKEHQNKDEAPKILHHGNTKNIIKEDMPYVRTTKATLNKVDYLLSKGKSLKDTYDAVKLSSGGPLYSTTQSSEPRNQKQIYNRKSSAKGSPVAEKEGRETNDEILDVLNEQRKNNFIRTVNVNNNNYSFFLCSDE